MGLVCGSSKGLTVALSGCCGFLLEESVEKWGWGGFPEVSLKEARELASDYRKMARQGIDPIKMRSQQRREALRPKSNLADYCGSCI